MPSLRDRRVEVFCQRYASSLNKRQAARDAGISAARADEQAELWLDDPQVQLRLDELLTPILRASDVDRDKIIEQYARMAFHDPRRCFDETGNILPMPMMDAEAAQGVRSYNPRKGVIAFHDPMAALNKLAEIVRVVAPEKGDSTVNVIIQRFSEPDDTGDLS